MYYKQKYLTVYVDLDYIRFFKGRINIMEYTSTIINKYSEFALAKPGITNHIKKECIWN
jgi:hypothetical protein